MTVMDHIFSVNIYTTPEIAKAIAEKVKQRRLERNLTQEGLSVRSGIPVGTYRRFERTGEISLHGLLQIAFALNCLADFKRLFEQKQYGSIDEMLEAKETSRQRGKKNE